MYICAKYRIRIHRIPKKKSLKRNAESTFGLPRHIHPNEIVDLLELERPVDNGLAPMLSVQGHHILALGGRT